AGGAEEAHYACCETNNQATHRADGTCCRGNGNQTGNHTRGNAQSAWLTVGQPLGEHPAQRFMAIWFTLVYAPIAHMVWSGVGGLLWDWGVLDFAGGTVVHINAGVAGLVACLVLGKRKGFPTTPMAPHNLGYTLVGAAMLWVGWFGFNAGSAAAANGTAGMAMLVTQIATAAAALGWMFAEWLTHVQRRRLHSHLHRDRDLHHSQGARHGHGPACYRRRRSGRSGPGSTQRAWLQLVIHTSKNARLSGHFFAWRLSIGWSAEGGPALECAPKGGERASRITRMPHWPAACLAATHLGLVDRQRERRPCGTSRLRAFFQSSCASGPRRNMSDDDIDNEGLEDDLEGEEDGEELAAAPDDDVADVEDSPEASATPAKGKAKAAVSVDELPSVEAKNKERDALARAMEEFLARGGKVVEVEANVVADPPKKPDNKYGSRPI
nr:ammonium transporter [Tanacetum cinerariifolium]